MKLLAVATLVACHATPSAPPKLAKPIDSLAFYVGTWHCEGTEYGPKVEHWTATVEVRPELDGSWLSVRMVGPGANRTDEHKGYDPEAKRWVHVAVGNDGLFALVTSPGWTGDHMVFTAEPDDQTRTTFTKLGERKYSHAVTRGDEKLWDKVCTKG